MRGGNGVLRERKRERERKKGLIGWLAGSIGLVMGSEGGEAGLKGEKGDRLSVRVCV